MKFVYTSSKDSVKMVAYSGVVMIAQISLQEKYNEVLIYEARMFCIASNSILLPTLDDCEEWIKSQFNFWLEMAQLQETQVNE